VPALDRLIAVQDAGLARVAHIEIATATLCDDELVLADFKLSIDLKKI
jgi:hypothetical protein